MQMMDSVLIGVFYVLGMILFWGLILGFVFVIYRFIKQKNDYNREVLHKLDEMIRLLKEMRQLNK